MEVLANRVKWLREKKRLGQKEVASNIGITLSGYQKIEYDQANPKLETLISLCDYFNVKSDFLLGRENSTDKLEMNTELLSKIDGQISSIKYKYENIMEKIISLRQEMIELSTTHGFTHEMTIQISKELDEKIALYKSYQQKVEDLENDKKRIILERIKEFLDIPNTTGNDDYFIDKYKPYKTSIQMNIFDEFEVQLIGEEIDLLGAYLITKDETEAVVMSKELVKRLNSRN
jgi:transcriptional regulator with XRE-family HTH domain